MNRSIVALAILMQAAMASADVSYVGLIYPPDPPHYKGLGGWMIDTSENGIACTLVQIEGKRMYWLNKQVGTKTETPKNAWPITRAVFEVTDVLPYPRLRHRETVITAADGECSVKGNPAESIIVVGAWAKKKGKTGEYVARVRQVWRANSATLRFETLDPSSVHCEYSEEEMRARD